MVPLRHAHDLVAAAEVAVGGDPEVRDWGLLESALARPKASVFGVDAYAGLNAKAATLLHSLVTNHALVDGNKRLGLVAVLLFYGMNGCDLTARRTSESISSSPSRTCPSRVRASRPHRPTVSGGHRPAASRNGRLPRGGLTDSRRG